MSSPGSWDRPRTGQEQDHAAPRLLQPPRPHLGARTAHCSAGNTYLPLCCFYEQHRGFVAFTACVKPAEMNKRAGSGGRRGPGAARGEDEAVKGSGERWWLL